MNRIFNATIWQEGEWFIAQCLEVDVASQGKTEEEALENMRDALELHFTPPVATVAPRVRTVEVKKRSLTLLEKNAMLKQPRKNGSYGYASLPVLLRAPPPAL